MAMTYDSSNGVWLEFFEMMDFNLLYYFDGVVSGGPSGTMDVVIDGGVTFLEEWGLTLTGHPHEYKSAQTFPSTSTTATTPTSSTTSSTTTSNITTSQEPTSSTPDDTSETSDDEPGLPIPIMPIGFGILVVSIIYRKQKR